MASELAMTTRVEMLGKALTRREGVVAEKTAEGLTAKEIGHALGISHRTVEIHKANAIAKLGARRESGIGRALARRECQAAEASLAKALGRCILFNAYRVADPLAIRFEFANDEDRLAAANAVDGAFRADQARWLKED